jgi:N utilization substance protein A
MQTMGGGPSTPIEQVVELGESVMEKLIAAGITTVESLADMTAEELGEIPGIGEKSVDKIAVAVRHYFGHYEDGEVRPETVAGETRPEPVASTEPATVPEPVLVASEVAVAAAAASDEAGDEIHSMSHTPEEIIAAEGAEAGSVEEVDAYSTEDIAAAEDILSADDANDSNDAREAGIELDNDTIDELVDQAQENSSEGID